jgi:hypothetical protein
MTDQAESAELAKLRRERDLYLRMLNLGRQSQLGPFLREAPALIGRSRAHVYDLIGAFGLEHMRS